MIDVSSETINELFMQKLDSKDGIDKIAQEGAVYIRQKLREVSFARKIVQPQYVTKADLQRSINHEGLVKIVDIEPDSKAMIVNFRGNASFNYVMGERFEIPFHMVSSEEFQKTEEELLAYEMPLTDVIEKNSVLDIQKIEDTAFIKQVDNAIATEVANGNNTSISGLYATTGAIGSIPKNKLKELFDTLDGNELRCELLLMDVKMYNRLFLYDATTVGDAVGSEMHINGYTYSTLFGRRLVISNKVSLLDNKIYAFTSQDFFGQFLILNDTKFFIEKKKNLINWSAYEIVGMGIGNTKSCSKLTLS